MRRAVVLIATWMLCAVRSMNAVIVNIDLNGQRDIDDVPPTYIGPGAAGGGPIFNGVHCDSRGLPTQDYQTFSASNLVDDNGQFTALTFSIGLCGGDNFTAGGVPEDPAALFGDYIFVDNPPSYSGAASFTVGGLGNAQKVDLYFYVSSATIVINGAATTPYSGPAPFTSANTIYFKDVAVTNGQVTGYVAGPSVVSGLTVATVSSIARVKSFAPTGDSVSPLAKIVVELEDRSTAVDPATIQLQLNDAPVTPQIQKSGLITRMEYQPATPFAPGAYQAKISFKDNGAPAATIEKTFSFTVVNGTLSLRVINIDFNGVRNTVTPDNPGPTYHGRGAAGGEALFNGILADSRTTGPDNDDLTIRGSNLVNSLGDATGVNLQFEHVGGDVGGAPTTDPGSPDALFSDYIFDNAPFNSVGAGGSPFEISGLTNAETIDVYFYIRSDSSRVFRFENGGYELALPPQPNGSIFNESNVVYFPDVPVVNGVVRGATGDGVNALTAVIQGMTIVLHPPRPTTPPGPLSVQFDVAAGEVVVAWPDEAGTAFLQACDDLNLGYWQDVAESSPFRISSGDPQRFYRLRR